MPSEHFSLHLPDDPGAPLALQVPHDWEQVRRARRHGAHRRNTGVPVIFRQSPKGSPSFSHYPYQAIAEICEAVEADISPGVNGAAASKQRRDPRRSPVVIAVCGAKGMGKSSVARLLTNRLLNCCQVSAAPLCNDQAKVGIRVIMYLNTNPVSWPLLQLLL